MFSFRSKLHFWVKHFDRTLLSPVWEPLWEAEGASLLQTFTRSIMPRLTSNIFFSFFFCRLAAQSDPFWVGWSRVGVKKWALSHWIMPLFQLLWPGMPNFTARYSSLCVNQSFARGRGAHWVRLQRRVIWSNHWSPTNQITHAHSALFLLKPGSLGKYL